MVADAWQGRGLGTVLFERLAARARELGVRRFVADTLFHNRRMLAVFWATGLPHAEPIEDGVVHVVLEWIPRRPQRRARRDPVSSARRRTVHDVPEPTSPAAVLEHSTRARTSSCRWPTGSRSSCSTPSRPTPAI